MNAAASITHIHSDPFVSCVSCPAKVDGNSKPHARNLARRLGWQHWNSGPKNAKQELWCCPECNPKRLAAIAVHETRRLTVFDGIAAEKKRKAEAELQEIAEKNKRIESKFERGFGRILDGQQMAACDLLRHAMAEVAKAGNATPSYDGISVDTYSFGSKTISDRVIRARSYERQCEIAVVCAVQMTHHDAWRIFRHAIENDVGAQDLGDYVEKSRRSRISEKRRREIAVDIVERASAAICALRY